MKNLLRIADVARITGLTKGTVYQYMARGVLPGPTLRIGPTNFYDPREVRAFMTLHNQSGARPNARKSIRLARRGRGRSA